MYVCEGQVLVVAVAACFYLQSAGRCSWKGRDRRDDYNTWSSGGSAALPPHTTLGFPCAWPPRASHPHDPLTLSPAGRPIIVLRGNDPSSSIRYLAVDGVLSLIKTTSSGRHARPCVGVCRVSSLIYPQALILFLIN